LGSEAAQQKNIERKTEHLVELQSTRVMAALAGLRNWRWKLATISASHQTMAELPDTLYQKIKVLCERGDGFAEREEFSAALEKYWSARDLLPEPKKDWDAATWILAAIGDANFLSGDFVAGKNNLATAMHCPDAIGNPFLHLRLGQCQFELGNLDRAADELTRAYAVGGEEIFGDEQEKYFEYLKTRIDAPPTG
jgi:tetratricopeptide (TPR) repeat protein